MQTEIINTINNLTSTGKKILFATMPMDGHFNPLTSLAIHLSEQGYDVRWYTGSLFSNKLASLGIPHFPFIKAKEITQHNLDTYFPERKNITGIKRLSFDMSNCFILRGPEFLADIQNVNEAFPFDLLIADICFTGIPFVKDVMKKPVISIGVIPLTEQSPDAPPPGLGLTPASSMPGKLVHRILNVLVNRVLLKEPNNLFVRLLKEHGGTTQERDVFEILIEKSDAVLQIGAPGFEYARKRMSRHIQFIGPLLPYTRDKQQHAFTQKLSRYKKVLLLTQGTLEPDVDKLIVPTLEVFKNTDKLVLVATGGNQTLALRERYACDNIVIEDYIDFSQVMPYVDVYISNGGYGGVLLSIMNNLPMVVGGKYEGKNEICARVGYFEVGINLKTEKPKKEQIRKAVDKVLADQKYKQNICKLSKEFATYQPAKICEKFVRQLSKQKATNKALLPV
ncbi:glycosyltransferase [Segetibacter sp. 3557_3]|uniref:glycosyltransferase n=1 Tax=Segetibacter sp. 3557_3 TaxID=2547429 RepID=UPI001058CC6F|nr:glycosyltransferase [Segetibacter sp. 3557_3]TDH24620.1 glycosyltransferase [Segetibacter sp. 3557_3]